MRLYFSFALGILLNLGCNAQRAPPGVNPHHYQQQQGGAYQQQGYQQQQQGYQQPQGGFQQQQQPQHYQQGVPQQQQFQQQQPPQQQFQQQQVPVQHQQVPVQHQQVPVQQQQAPVQHQGGHDHHGQPQLLNTANMAHEKQHIAEHLEVPMDTSKMSEQELQFHYFKMHDADNNNKLDGCELIKSLIHWHEQSSHENKGPPEAKIFKDDELISLIDPILNVDDFNKDGYIDYPEFVRAQQKAAVQQNKQP